jgi:hypothetical protein
MWIPDPLYNKLPALYVTAGLALIPLFGPTGPCLLSAALLVAAGALTSMWRFRHRQPEPEAIATPKEEWAQRKARREQVLSEMDQ